MVFVVGITRRGIFVSIGELVLTEVRVVRKNSSVPHAYWPPFHTKKTRHEFDFLRAPFVSFVSSW